MERQIKKTIDRIAREILGCTLKEQGRDHLDFNELHVKELEAALAAAFEAGKKHAEEN